MCKSFKVLGLVIALGCRSVLQADAAVVMNLSQQGSNVVLVAAGTLNTTGLSQALSGSGGTLDASLGMVIGGEGSAIALGSISGPTNLGSGAGAHFPTATGDAFGVFALYGYLLVPSDYVSGTELSTITTWNNTSLEDLGFTPGTYVWTWGIAADADSLTLHVIPEPSTWALLGLGLTGTALFRRRLAK